MPNLDALIDTVNKLTTVQASPRILDNVVASWLKTDLELDKTHPGGYAPTKGVLESRESNRQFSVLEDFADRLIEPPHWIDHNGNRGVSVGLRDNRDPNFVDDSLRDFLAAAKRMGFKPRKSSASFYNVDYDAKRVKASGQVINQYLRVLAQNGSRGAKKALG